MRSIGSKPTALLLLGMETAVNENPFAQLRPAAAQSAFNKAIRRCVGTMDGTSLWEDDLVSCLYIMLADKWLSISALFNSLSCFVEATCPFSSQSIFIPILIFFSPWFSVFLVC